MLDLVKNDAVQYAGTVNLPLAAPLVSARIRADLEGTCAAVIAATGLEHIQVVPVALRRAAVGRSL